MRGDMPLDHTGRGFQAPRVVWIIPTSCPQSPRKTAFWGLFHSIAGCLSLWLVFCNFPHLRGIFPRKKTSVGSLQATLHKAYIYISPHFPQKIHIPSIYFSQPDSQPIPQSQQQAPITTLLAQPLGARGYVNLKPESRL